MPRRLSTKISISILGVLALALLSSGVALMAAWRLGQVMVKSVRDNLPSLQAADDLEVALLEQRGFVSSYILDHGNPRWIDELAKSKPRFDRCYATARKTALRPDEFLILDELLVEFARYDTKRNEVITLFDQGDEETARRVLLRDVLPLHKEADRLSKKFHAANVRFINEMADQASRQIRHDTWLVGACVLLTLCAGTALFWQFAQGVLRPLRQMLAEARGFSPDWPDNSSTEEDDLEAVGAHLRLLMSGVADARTTLERNRIELRNAEKLASVGKLAASVAHEIRNPLTSIKMWLFWIRGEVMARPDVDDAFGVVEDELSRLEAVVRNFLEFSRPPEARLAPCEVGPLLDATLQLMEHRFQERKVQLHQQAAAALPPMMADAHQIKQVLINLLDNALDACPAGGQIALSAVVESDVGGAAMVVIRVCDSGGGIPPEAAARIFEPFFSTKDRGTGLGLCIAASIMARHRGRLVLESSSASGTCFAVWTPVAAETGDDKAPVAMQNRELNQEAA